MTGEASGDPERFDAMRRRWVGLHIGNGVTPDSPAAAPTIAALDQAADRLWSTVDVSAGSTPWPDLPDRPDARAALSHQRLRTLALAWATPGTAVHGSAELADDIGAALELVNRSTYHERAAETGNWWYWEIGAPRALLDTCALLGSALSAARVAEALRAVAWFVPDPNHRTNRPGLAETGANRVDKALITCLSGLLARDPDRIAAGRDAVSDVAGGGTHSVFRYVTSGDGFYRDGSFIQHDNLPYAGAYGHVALTGIAELLFLLADSPWQLTDPDQTVVLDAVERTFAPFMVGGRMMDCVRGRAVSRERERDRDAGHRVTDAVLLLADSAPAEYAVRFRSLAKSWLLANGREVAPTLGHHQRALATVADEAVVAAPDSVGHQQFPAQDRVVHHRPGWSFALALCSRRIARFEWGNQENAHGWYSGDGMSYVYTGDPGQFTDDFWPTVDPYLLPGTTVSAKPRESHWGSGTVSNPATTIWVGGTVQRDRYGAVGMDHESWDGSLRARKSWFCLDDRVVALGAGITGNDHDPIRTCVDNRNLRPDDESPLLVDGQPQPATTDWSARFDGARWAHLAGVGGYLFLGPEPVSAARRTRTGSWHDIDAGPSTGGSTDPVTRRYVSLWFDHGVDPAGAGYAYAVLPLATAQTTADCAANPLVTVLANDIAVQAVQVADPDLVLANFYAAGRAGPVQVDGPCSVIVGRADGHLTVSVSDPSRTADTVRVEIDRPATDPITADPGITVVQLAPTVVLDVLTAEPTGQTKTVRLNQPGFIDQPHEGRPPHPAAVDQ